MTSHATDGPIREALGGRIDGERVDAFEQGASLRLTPDGCLFRGDDGLPSVHATGHGDLPEALAAAGLLDRFLAAGGRYLWIMNLDNLGAAVDPLVLGWHIDHGGPLTVEVVDKQEGDRGGIPVRLDDRPVVLENFRLPDGLRRGHGAGVQHQHASWPTPPRCATCECDWSWFRVEKTVDGRPAIQFERLVGELTSVLESRFLRVPRLGRGVAVPAGQELGRAGRPPRADRRPHRADAGTGSRQLVTPPWRAAAVASPVHALLDLLVPPALRRLPPGRPAAAAPPAWASCRCSTGPPAPAAVCPRSARCDDCASCRGRRLGFASAAAALRLRRRRAVTWCTPSRTAACAVSPSPRPR